MKKILCKKDWDIDNILVFKSGKQYSITDVCRLHEGVLGVRVKSKHLQIWFWEGSEYFDVSSYFE